MILTFFNLVTVLPSLCGLCYLILHQPYEIGATGLILHMYNQIYIIECLSVTEPVNTGDKCEPKPTFVFIAKYRKAFEVYFNRGLWICIFFSEHSKFFFFLNYKSITENADKVKSREDVCQHFVHFLSPSPLLFFKQNWDHTACINLYSICMQMTLYSIILHIIQYSTVLYYIVYYTLYSMIYCVLIENMSLSSYIVFCCQNMSQNLFTYSSFMA